MAQLMDGRALAAKLREEIAEQTRALTTQTGVTPGLAVVLVGEDPASQIYVRNKHKATTEVGMNSFVHTLPQTATQDELLALVRQLNADAAVHGILVQLPLPKQFNEDEIIRAIDPAKDVDAFHPLSAGALLAGSPGFVPCTPRGAMALLDAAGVELAGKKAVVIGRSNIVGKPMALLLLARDCTVTICHSRTQNLPEVVREADIVVAAVGRAKMVRGSWLKPGCAVVDVGINRMDGKVVGDVDFDEAAQIAAAITPVPGGVGPMTIAMLLQNTLEGARRSVG